MLFDALNFCAQVYLPPPVARIVGSAVGVQPQAAPPQHCQLLAITCLQGQGGCRR